MADTVNSTTQMVTRSLYIHENLAAKLDALASSERRSFSNYVSLALENHIAQSKAADADKQPVDSAQPTAA